MKREGRGYWEEQVKAFAASGLSRAAFCRQHGLRYNRLYAWQGRLAKASAPTKAKAFVRAKAAPARAVRDDGGPRGARLVTASGIALEFQASTDPRWIARVLAELGGAR